jgi:Secretion system C-terminal sorting domain
MRLLYVIILVLAAGAGHAQTTSVLWLGNSYTAANNLPDLFYQLALSGGDSVTYNSNTPGGYTLQMHSQNATSLQLINQQPWDFVVVQAQSQEPSFDPAYVNTNVFPYATFLDSAIQNNDSCTQTVFYMTWGRKNGDASNCAAWPPVCTYLGMQGLLRERYVQMAHDNNAVTAPCGEAWRNVIATTPTYDLYIADESHPSLYGSYLNACVFYATMFRKSPVGLPYMASLPTGDAYFLQQVAAATVFDSMGVWNTNINYADPGFTAVAQTGLTYTFNANAAMAMHQWNFGSGFVAGSANETYTFPAAGNYVVEHVTWNGCLYDTLRDTVQIVPAGLATYSPEEFRVYTGSNSLLNVTAPASVTEMQIEIIDVSGRVVKSQMCYGSSAEISTAELMNGIYHVRLTTVTGAYVKSVSVIRN